MSRSLALLAVLILIVSAAYYYSRDSQGQPTKEPDTGASEKQEAPKGKVPVLSGNQSNSSEPRQSQNNIEARAEKASLPHWKAAFSNYKVPEENLSDEVNEILTSIEKDASGKPELKLFRILDYCAQAAKNEEQLQELKTLHEDSSLLTGQSNGETLDNINRAVTHYKECKSLESKELLQSYDYLEVSAAKGNPKARTVLATLYEPKNFSDWPEEEKERYKQKMEKNLSEARKSCEPQAFYSYAYGVGEGNLWDDSSDIPKNVRKYSNLLARGMIYANKTRDAEEYLVSRHAELKSIASNMMQHEVSESEKYGRYLYNQSCE